MHIKRQEAPKSWPIPRKGTVYVAKPRFNLKKGIPLIVIIRDFLKIAQTRREVKRALHLKEIYVNEKPVKDERHGISFFDTIKIIPLKKSYRFEIAENGKFKVEEIKDSETKTKIIKIIGKRVLKNKKIQLNLSDGRNFLSDMKCNVNDSVVVNLSTGKIEKCIPLKEKTKAVVFEGKHSGEKGVIESINKESKMAELTIKNNKVNVLIKQIMVIE